MTMRSPLEISFAELSERLRRGERVYLVDVREEWEHQTARLPGDVLIPLAELPSRLDEVQPAPGQLLVAYCHHGIRSRSAVAILRNAGFEEAVSLAGGIDLWSRAVDPSIPQY